MSGAVTVRLCEACSQGGGEHCFPVCGRPGSRRCSLHCECAPRCTSRGVYLRAAADGKPPSAVELRGLGRWYVVEVEFCWADRTLQPGQLVQFHDEPLLERVLKNTGILRKP